MTFREKPIKRFCDIWLFSPINGDFFVFSGRKNRADKAGEIRRLKNNPKNSLHVYMALRAPRFHVSASLSEARQALLSPGTRSQFSEDPRNGKPGPAGERLASAPRPRGVPACFGMLQVPAAGGTLGWASEAAVLDAWKLKYRSR